MHNGLRANARLLLAPLIAGALVVSVASCTPDAPSQQGAVQTLGSGPASPSPHPSIGRVTTPTSPTDLVRPIQKYLLDPANSLRLYEAQREQVLACAEQASGKSGLKWTYNSKAVLAFIELQKSNLATRSPLWGFFDPSNVAETGYEQVPGSVTNLTLKPIPGVPGALTQQCLNDTQAAMGLQDTAGPVFSGVPSILPGRGPYVPSDDPKFVAAEKAWSACMSRAGFSYRTPLDAQYDPAWLHGKNEQRQKATAMADITCKLKTNLVGVGLAVQAAYDDAYISSHKASLNKFEGNVRRYVRVG